MLTKSIREGHGWHSGNVGTAGIRRRGRRRNANADSESVVECFVRDEHDRGGRGLGVARVAWKRECQVECWVAGSDWEALYFNRFREPPAVDVTAAG